MFHACSLVLVILVGLSFAAISFPSDSGFQVSTIASNLNPTQLAALPDGRILMLEKQGLVRVVKNDVMLSVGFNISDTVNDFDERGLLGIAVDPNFNSNRYIYLYYTREGSTLKNRVSRFTMTGDTIDSATEQLIFELDPLGSAGNHNGGGISFGADGKLYIGVGENTVASNAQTTSSLLGKIHRINSDGSIPTDNPMYGTLTGNYRAIYAMGVRNPWTIHAAASGELLIFDVGFGTYEEINLGVANANYGWPTYEGYTASPTGIANYQNPIYNFGRGSTSTSGCSIMGGLVYKNVSAMSRFPSKFHDAVFFADYCNAWINYFPVSSPPTIGAPSSPANVFLTGLSAPVHIIESPDGSLYITDRGSSAGGSSANTAVTTGTLYKVTYTGNFAPVIYQQPQSALAAAGATVTFTVGVTGYAPLSYQWQKNGVNITGATGSSYTTPALSVSDSGATYAVLVSNAYPPSVLSSTATLTVTARSLPTVTFASPLNNTLYTAGDTISYSASATDSVDGDLSASSFSWVFVFHHQTHTHPFIGPIANNAKSGTFVLPTSGEPDTVQWYRLHLDVTNSAGLVSSSYVDILPRVVWITLNVTSTSFASSSVSVSLDGQTFSSPYTFAAVVGMTRTIGVSLPSSMQFVSWSDGGELQHTITVPSSNATLTVSLADSSVNTGTQSQTQTASQTPSQTATGNSTATTQPSTTGSTSGASIVAFAPLLLLALTFILNL